MNSIQLEKTRQRFFEQLEANIRPAVMMYSGPDVLLRIKEICDEARSEAASQNISIPNTKTKANLATSATAGIVSLITSLATIAGSCGTLPYEGIKWDTENQFIFGSVAAAFGVIAAITAKLYHFPTDKITEIQNRAEDYINQHKNHSLMI